MDLFIHLLIYSKVISLSAFVLLGFELGSTVQSKTKGIWVWCVPHPMRKNCCLVLLDTEGLGDVEKVAFILSNDVHHTIDTKTLTPITLHKFT